MSLILEFLLVLMVSTACSAPIPSQVEVTKIVPKTVTVTQLEPIKVDSTLQTTDLDPKYFDGIIVVTQYYTFLGNGLPDKAFDLYSSTAKSARTKEDFIQMATLSFKSVQIISIFPYFYAVKQQGGMVKPDPDNIARFAVQIKAWGEGKMSGSRLNGELQDLFLELIKVNDGWKINSFSTAPFP